MADRQILESTVTLNQSCLLKEEQKEVYNLFTKYRGAFSLRHEIGTCPSIEVHLKAIDVFICLRHFHII